MVNCPNCHYPLVKNNFINAFKIERQFFSKQKNIFQKIFKVLINFISWDSGLTLGGNKPKYKCLNCGREVEANYNEELL